MNITTRILLGRLSRRARQRARTERFWATPASVAWRERWH
jgi:hypothetical protein